MGLEYNGIRNLFSVVNLNSTGYSVYGIYSIGKNTELFGRFDRLRYRGVSDPGSVPGDGMGLITGISLSPAKGLSFSLNYQYFTPDDEDLKCINQLRLSMNVSPEF